MADHKLLNEQLEGVSDAQIQAMKRQRRAKHTPNQNTLEKQAKICQLRVEGYSWPEIANMMGMTVGHAHAQHARAMKKIIEEPAQEVRELELRRLDLMLQSLHTMYVKFFPLVSAGQVVRDTLEDEMGNPILNEEGNHVTIRLEDVGPRLSILDRMLKIQERRARLLGLDAPSRKSLEGPDGGPIKFDQNSLRGLSDAELTMMVSLLEKATGNDASSQPAGGS